MTIVLQHQFWDLAPGETFFSVTLKFGGQPKTLSVPYAAITQFWDPSVDYRLRFAVPEPPPKPTASPPAASRAPRSQGVRRQGRRRSPTSFRSINSGRNRPA